MTVINTTPFCSNGVVFIFDKGFTNERLFAIISKRIDDNDIFELQEGGS